MAIRSFEKRRLSRAIVNSSQPVKISGILLAAIVAVWLCESTRESSTTDHNKAGKFGLIQESVDEVLTQNPEIDGLSRESSDAHQNQGGWPLGRCTGFVEQADGRVP
ncbi:hypothetical protein [Candidatus Pelagisphaera phototrophica]|uniref:hypothetical protein n=1 Tax=Candidatus Pelagisphaera phototrophica TaxID=2684113 RepID=UPI001A02CC36|nr:hypothetical protein [Candidatus Pelagisphaera phototrophica]QXD32073.1 hypothetical protein GA004_17525 [Candidatus Pelagisphaera phototrophica]